jgi:phytoene synthase
MDDRPAMAARALRDADRDCYLSTLYAPAEMRAALTALYLFNAEIAGIRDRIHEPMPGEIRIQWWRDAIANGDPAGHPVAQSLSQAIETHGLPLDAFDRYLQARIFDLYDDPMPSRADLEGYCGETASTIIQLAALVLEPEAAPHFASAAGHAGCARGIAGLLRLLPVHLRRGQCYVPADILAAAGTDRDGFVSGVDAASSGRVLDAMVALGRDHLRCFEAEAAGMPPSLRPAFLPASLAAPYLARIDTLGQGARTRTDGISEARRQWTLLRRALRGWG